jgi:alkanesulfonate monooxygenase SsuD/methylene tetrahydromethanopterin reductase-like flavin-dependent oxidoreductase (luciferase family)
VTWRGRFRPALEDAAVYPRPFQAELPIWVGVGGTPQSFVRAGTLGLPLMVAIIGGQPKQFRPLVDLYRAAGSKAGHPPERLRVGVHIIGFVGESDDDAAETYFPGWQREFTRIGRERGWGPATRPQFDALRGPGGAFLIGSPETVAAKIATVDRDLGGLARINLQMTVAHLPHEKMLRAIELLGRAVAPNVRERPG